MKRLCLLPIFSALFLHCLAGGADQAAFAASAEVLSIRITPERTVVGTYPVISGIVKVINADAPNGEQEITVVAVLYRPDNILKSWTWKNVRMRADETRQFAMPQEYSVKLPGTYKVDYNVYTKEMRPLHRLSGTFIAADFVQGHPGEAAPPEEPFAVAAPSPGRPSRQPDSHRYLGLGLYANALNPAGGATILFWPFKYVGLQGSYTAGVFTSAEGRLLIRFPFSSGVNPYFGAGYVDVLKDEQIIGVKTRFRDNNVSGVAGVEFHLSKSVYFYTELSSASIRLEKQVSSGSQKVYATVEYAPVSIGFGIVTFIF